jgi:hypothetical protein
MNAPHTPPQWIPLSCSPVPWMRLAPDGGCRIGASEFAPGARIVVRMNAVKVRKRAGLGQPIRLRTPLGEAILRFRDGAWERFLLPADLDPFPHDDLTEKIDDLNPPTPAAERKSIPIPPGLFDAPRPPRTPRKPFRWLWRRSRAALVTTLLVAGTVAASLAAGTSGWVLTPADIDAGWGYRHLAHAVVNPTHGQLLLWLVGLVAFGLLVERNAGGLRALAVVAAGAVGGVFGYELFNTPDGQQTYSLFVWRTFVEIAANIGWGAAQAFAEAAGWLFRVCQWDGSVSGSGGVVGALISYAVVRRRLAPVPGHLDGPSWMRSEPHWSRSVAFRPVKLVLAVAFLIALAFAWPVCAGGPFPAAMLVGGFVGGMAVIFPEKAVKWLAEKLAESWRKRRDG